MRSNSNKYLVHLALFTVAALYAGNFSFAKWAMPEYISSYAFIVLRVGGGALFFWVYFKLFVNEKIKDKRDYLDLAISGFFGVALNMSAFFKGLSLTTAINASVLMLLAPVFVVVFSAIGNKKRVKYRVIVGIAIALIGAALLISGTNIKFSSEGLLGDALIMINAISYAFYLYFVVRLLKKYKAITITYYIFLFGFLYVLPFGIGDLAKVDWHLMPPKAIFGIGYAVFGITILAYLLNAWALQRSTSTTVGSYIYLQPVLATTIAVLVGMDVITYQKAMYAAVIVLGLWLVNRK
ncbi:MAG: DMT family transporter [Bacteroidia bacterium]|nr:DMT family transporter [Bacteroidia bacterium]NNJ55027.1 DMT family transporter [Bacteroidia bacterium]